MRRWQIALSVIHLGLHQFPLGRTAKVLIRECTCKNLMLILHVLKYCFITIHLGRFRRKDTLLEAVTLSTLFLPPF